MEVSAPTTLKSFATPANATTTGAQTATGSASVGDFVVASVVGGGASQTLGFSDSAGNSYTALTAVGIASGVATTARLFVSFITNPIVSGVTTFTATKGVSGGISFIVQAYQDVLSYGAQTTANSTTAANPATHAGVAVPAGGAIHTFLGMNSIITGTPVGSLQAGATVSGGGGSNPRNGATYYQLSAGGETVTPQVTLSSNNAYVLVSIPLTPVDDPPDPSPAGSTLAIIGDSLTERGSTTPAPPTRETATKAVMVDVGNYEDADIFWYGKGGKSMSGDDSAGNSVAENITAARAALTDVDNWIIALGTNDYGAGESAFKARVNATLDLIYVTGSEPDHVYWPNFAALNPTNTGTLDGNEWLPEVVAARDEVDRIHVLEWHAFIHDPDNFDTDDWLPADVPHMTVQGSAKRDTFLANAVKLNLPVLTDGLTVWDGAVELPVGSVTVWDGAVELPVGSVTV